GPPTSAPAGPPSAARWATSAGSRMPWTGGATRYTSILQPEPSSSDLQKQRDEPWLCFRCRQTDGREGDGVAADYGSNYDRLAQIKKHYDSDNLGSRPDWASDSRWTKNNVSGSKRKIVC